MLKNGSGGTRRPGSGDAVRPDGASGGGGSMKCDGPSVMLSLRRLDAGELAGLDRSELEAVLGDIERVANRLAGYPPRCWEHSNH